MEWNTPRSLGVNGIGEILQLEVRGIGNIKTTTFFEEKEQKEIIKDVLYLQICQVTSLLDQPRKPDYNSTSKEQGFYLYLVAGH